MMRCNLRGELHCSHMLRIAFYAVHVRPCCALLHFVTITLHTLAQMSKTSVIIHYALQ
jgi:hypothetical protein